MSRLTKALKETIINNWKEEKHLNIEQKLTDKVNAELRSLFEKEKAYEISIVKNNKDLLKFIKTHCYFGTDTYDSLDFIINCKNITCDTYASTRHYSCDEIDTNSVKYKKIIKKYQDIWSEYIGQVNSITSVMDSVTTVKRLIDILPEIEKYVPATSSATTLVASGDLVKAKSVL